MKNLQNRVKVGGDGLPVTTWPQLPFLPSLKALDVLPKCQPGQGYVMPSVVRNE